MKKAKILKNGQNQAIRLPKEFRFDGEKVFIKKVGKAIMLIPLNNPWESLFASYHSRVMEHNPFLKEK